MILSRSLPYRRNPTAQPVFHHGLGPTRSVHRRPTSGASRTRGGLNRQHGKQANWKARRYRRANSRMGCRGALELSRLALCTRIDRFRHDVPGNPGKRSSFHQAPYAAQRKRAHQSRRRLTRPPSLPIGPRPARAPSAWPFLVCRAGSRAYGGCGGPGRGGGRGRSRAASSRW